MKDKVINQDEAAQTLMLWQQEGRVVEIRLRYRQGVTQTHSGCVTVEPDGRVVVADVESRDRYFTTVLLISAFGLIKLSDNENAITFTESRPSSGTFKAITIACRQQ